MNGLQEQASAIKSLVLAVLQEFRRSGYSLSRQDLCARVGTSDRVLRAAVAELRRDGHLVVAEETGGYQLARSWDEVERYTASLRSRITALREIVDAMERGATQQFGSGEQQLGLW